MNVSQKRHRRLCAARTSTQRDFLGCSGDKVARNPYFEAKLVPARALLVGGSACPSVKVLMVKQGTDYVP